MATKTARRRLDHKAVDERKDDHSGTSRSDTLNEPLLGKYDGEGHSKKSLHIPDEKKREPLCWTHLFSHLFTRCAKWIANVFIRTRSLLRRLFSRPSQHKQDNQQFPTHLSALQEERLINLRQRLERPFDGTCVDHQDALKQLWTLAYPHRELPSLKSELWKEMGWQGPDPSTDFRSGGFISLENLIFYAKSYPQSFQRLLHKEDGKRSEWEYPFAAAGVNVSFMLTEMLGLKAGTPTSKTGVRFLELLGRDEMAFDSLYCVAFQLLDSKWISMRASYMEFNEVLKSTRTQLEHELGLDGISRIQELPAYSLLNP